MLDGVVNAADKSKETDYLIGSAPLVDHNNQEHEVNITGGVQDDGTVKTRGTSANDAGNELHGPRVFSTDDVSRKKDINHLDQIKAIVPSKNAGDFETSVKENQPKLAE